MNNRTANSASELALFPRATRDADITIAATLAVDYVPTPAWLCHAMIERYLQHVGPNDIILEPTAGDGAFLREMPPHFNAYGIELDPTLAAQARASSGREVFVGDVLDIELPYAPTAIISNPPYSASFLDRFLARFHRILPANGTITFLLPVYLSQTSNRLSRYVEHFSIRAEIVPRDIFPGLHLPLSIVTYTNDGARRLFGLAFFDETNEWRRMPQAFHDILMRSKRNVWVEACLHALEIIGRPASVDEIARVVAGSRPTKTAHWREAIRKALQLNFTRTDRGVYAIPSGNVAIA